MIAEVRFPRQGRAFRYFSDMRELLGGVLKSVRNLAPVE